MYNFIKYEDLGVIDNQDKETTGGENGREEEREKESMEPGR